MKSHFLSVMKLVFLCCCIILLLVLVEDSHSRSIYDYLPSNPFRVRSSSSADDNEATKSSLLRIDPSRIISTMIKKGGLVLDKSTRKDLLILDQVSSARSTYLDVYNKELEVRNWTVTPPNSKDASPSLRVGRIFIKWDSYLRPCVDIRVEDVDIMVDFSNLRLTQSNWCVH
jgi:hypothetical protein